jgi:hypothetical protein
MLYPAIDTSAMTRSGKSAETVTGRPPQSYPPTIAFYIDSAFINAIKSLANAAC